MSDFMNFFTQIILAFVTIGGMFVFGYMAYIILDEFGRKAIKGQMKANDYLNAVVGIGLLCLMLVYGISGVLFSINEGWKLSAPYINDLQSSILEGVNTAFGGQAGVINYNDTTTNINVNDVPPQAPTAQEGGGEYGQGDDNVGGGGYLTSTPMPTQVKVLPTPTSVILVATDTPSWEAPPLP